MSKKVLQQITFDFGVPEDQEAPAPSAPAPEPEPEPVVVEEGKEELIIEMVLPDPPAPSPAAIAEKKPSGRGRRPLKEAALSADLLQVPDDEILFQKQYYSIGEVAGMFREKQSLIRYWETEFDILQPRKNRKGDRFFRPVDVKNLVLIHDLLRRRKFTIEGARDYLKKNSKAEEKFAMIQSLQKIKAFLLELKANL